jgi:hypothetical protein
MVQITLRDGTIGRLTDFISRRDDREEDARQFGLRMNFEKSRLNEQGRQFDAASEIDRLRIDKQHEIASGQNATAQFDAESRRAQIENNFRAVMRELDELEKVGASQRETAAQGRSQSADNHAVNLRVNTSNADVTEMNNRITMARGMSEPLVQFESAMARGDEAGARAVLMGAANIGGFEFPPDAPLSEMERIVRERGAQASNLGHLQGMYEHLPERAGDNVDRMTGMLTPPGGPVDSRHVGINPQEALMNNIWTTLENTRVEGYRGDTEAFLQDPTVQQLLKRYAKINPALQSYVANRPHVDTNNPGLDFKDLDDGFMFPIVNNDRGEKAPITQQGSYFRDNPNDPAIAVDYGDLYRLAQVSATSAGGGMDVVPAAADALLAQTRPIQQQGNAPLAALHGQAAGLMNPEEQKRLLAGEALTPHGQTRQEQRENLQLSSAKRLNDLEVDRRAPRPPEDQKKLDAEWGSSTLLRAAQAWASENMGDDGLSKSAKRGLINRAWGFEGRHRPWASWREARHSQGLTAGQKAALGWEEGQPRSQTATTLGSMVADVQTTLSNPENMRAISNHLGLTDSRGRLVSHPGDLNDQQTQQIMKLFGEDRKGDKASKGQRSYGKLPREVQEKPTLRSAMNKQPRYQTPQSQR